MDILKGPNETHMRPSSPIVSRDSLGVSIKGGKGGRVILVWDVMELYQGL